ncbi:hypothetical protein ASG52_17690 [Methylobacterium sp. Leaf456]|nr:hypothetical protein ASG52_17690 [Methylobacterium sp. Leaf456]
MKMRTIAGASAGAITGALGIVALKRGLSPEALSEAEIGEADYTSKAPPQRIRCVLPSLHKAWVEQPRMVAEAGSKAKDLLGSDDLAEMRRVLSLLNAKLVDDIENDALACPPFASVPEDQPDHLKICPGPFPFLAATMHIFMTVTNLRGIPFNLFFGQARYGMLTHGDRLHYQIENIGAPLTQNTRWDTKQFLQLDQKITLDANTLPSRLGAEVPPDWKSYGNSALASAAFPGGLAPRLIDTPFSQYIARQYPMPVQYGTIKANFPSACDLKKSFRFLSIDGGVVNNSPFDFVEAALWDFDEPREASRSADRAVLMVAPFPEPPTFLDQGQPEAELGAVVKALLPTLLNQARFRSSELGRALDSQDRSRFLISPVRSLKEGETETYPIACGLLGGFGGFLHEPFRAHDYQLGRRNCQHFLATVFSLPPQSPSIKGEGQVNTKHRGDCYDSPGEVLIIPLLGEAAREVGLPPWPQITGKDLQTLLRRIQKRLRTIQGPLIEAQIGKSVVQLVANILLNASSGRILRFIETKILADLVRRNQIVGWELPAELLAADTSGRVAIKADDARAVLAQLILSGKDGATAQEIAPAIHIDEPIVRLTLARLTNLPVDRTQAVLRNGERYSLQMFIPTGLRALPLVGKYLEHYRPQPFRYT